MQHEQCPVKLSPFNTPARMTWGIETFVKHCTLYLLEKEIVSSAVCLRHVRICLSLTTTETLSQMSASLEDTSLKWDWSGDVPRVGRCLRVTLAEPCSRGTRDEEVETCWRFCSFSPVSGRVGADAENLSRKSGTNRWGSNYCYLSKSQHSPIQNNTRDLFFPLNNSSGQLILLPVF